MAFRRKIVRGVAGSAALIGVAVAMGGCGADAHNPTMAPAAASVLVTEVQPQRVAVYADFAAQTYARDMVEVRGRVEGYLEQWKFRPGQEVDAGQVLYVLDLRPYEAAVQQARGALRQSEADLDFAKHQVSLAQAQANLASAEANLLKARQDHDRLKPLAEAEAAAKQDLDAAVAALKGNEANVTSLKAQVEQTGLSTRTQIEAMLGRMEANKAALRTAELNLGYGVIKAPIAGRIGDSQIPVGGLVNPNSPQPLTTIVPLDPIWVRFKVTEAEYLSWAKRGRKTFANDLPATLVLADNSEFPYKGRITDALNQVDPRTGTLELQARFPNPKHTLLPGQFGRVRVEVEEKADALAVPQRAVQQLQNMQMVYTVGAGNLVEARAITTGDRTGDQWVVERGLRAGDRVIVEGQLKVRPGARVDPRPYRAAGK
jgi:membrane fusion protein (multidrug efflux system)